MNAAVPGGLLRCGIHSNVSRRLYHGDPAADGVSVSSGLLRALSTQSPEHAWAQHPRLNPGYEPKPPSDAANRGTILHAMTLGGEVPYRAYAVPDWRGKNAQLRDDCIDEGLIPIRRDVEKELLDVAAALRARLQAMPEVWQAMRSAVERGMVEATLIWRERGVLCRSLLDTLPAAGFGACYDLKFTGLSVDPVQAGKTIPTDYRFQADLYMRGVQALRGDRPDFVFIAVETEPPYGVTLHSLGPGAAEAAREDVDEALAMWAECLRLDRWPCYPSAVYYHELPGWVARQREERQVSREMLKTIGAGR